MPRNNPYWYNLIYYWVNDRGRTGLTIPFIIGAKQYFDSHDGLDSIRELIMKIKGSHIESVITVSKCPNIREVVLGITNYPSGLPGEKFNNEHTGHTTLVFTTNALPYNKGKDINTLCYELEIKYGSYIDKNKYSVNNRKWGPFTHKDIEIIKESIERYGK